MNFSSELRMLATATNWNSYRVNLFCLRLLQWPVPLILVNLSQHLQHSSYYTTRSLSSWSDSPEIDTQFSGFKIVFFVATNIKVKTYKLTALFYIYIKHLFSRKCLLSLLTSSNLRLTDDTTQVKMLRENDNCISNLQIYI